MNSLKKHLVISGVLVGVLAACSGADVSSDRQSNAVSFEIKSEVDSAYRAFRQADSKEIVPLANRLFHLLDQNEATDSLIQYSSAARVEEVVSYADYWMGEYLYQTQRQKEAMTVAQLALKEAIETGDKDLQTNVNSLLSAVYMRLGMFDNAATCLQICLDESTRTGNQEDMSSDLNNLAALFISLKHYDKAKAHIDRAIEIEKKLGRDDVLAVRYGIASETYTLLNLLPEAERFARQAYELDAKAGREGKAAVRLSQLASVLIKKGELAEAKEVFYQAVPMLKASGNTYSYIICENQLGDIFLKEKDYKNAVAHYLTALDLSKSNEYRYMKQRALSGLWHSLRNTNISRAAAYLEQYTTLTDSLHTESTEKQLANLQAQYEYVELQAANERLTYQNHINRLLWLAGIVACLLVITILCYFLHVKSRAEIIARQTGVLLDLIGEKTPEQNEPEVEPAAESEQQPETSTEVKAGEADLSQSDSEFFNKFVGYVNAQLAQGKPVNAADCAANLCVSPRHFSRKVMAITGYTPSACINRIKISCAKRLLDTEPDLTITEVSQRSGFEDLAYFGKIFRQMEGMTPSQYKGK